MAEEDKEIKAARLTRVKEIREAVILDHGEFSPLILSRELEERDLPPYASAATDGKTIWYNPDFVDGADDKNVAGALLHESLHIGLCHTIEGRIADIIGPVPPNMLIGAPPQNQEEEEYLEKMNLLRVAGDYVVNPILKAAGFDVTGRLYDVKFEGMSLEEVYNQLLQNNPRKKAKGKKHEGCVLVMSPGTGQETEEQVKAAKQAFEDFLVLARMRGTLPGSMLEALGSILAPKIPWEEMLRNLVQVVCGRDDYTWKRPSRRGLVVDLYLPSGIDQSIQCIGFGSDTSQSMPDKDCAKAVQAVVSAGEAVKIRKFVWAEGDAAVQRVLEFEGMFEPPTDVKGRGGTDFRPIIEELLKHDPACIIYFTDLEGIFPEHQPTVPMIWVTVGENGQAPWGEVVRIE